MQRNCNSSVAQAGRGEYPRPALRKPAIPLSVLIRARVRQAFSSCRTKKFTRSARSGGGHQSHIIQLHTRYFVVYLPQHRINFLEARLQFVIVFCEHTILQRRDFYIIKPGSQQDEDTLAFGYRSGLIFRHIICSFHLKLSMVEIICQLAWRPK